MLERVVEARLVKAIKEHGGLALKMPAIWYKGIPDRLCLAPNARLVWVETKRPKGGRVTKHQNWWMNLFARMGFKVMIVEDENGINRVLEYLFS